MTQSIDIHADFDISETSPKQEITKSKASTIMASVLAHGLVFFLLFYFSGFTSKSLNKKQEDISAIKATLYFPPPPMPEVEVQPEPEAVDPVLPPEEPVAVEQAPDSIPEKTAPEKVEPEAPSPDLTEPVTEANTEQPVAPESPTTTTIESQEQSSAGRLERLNRALSSHLNSLHEKQVTEMSQEASRNWQQDHYQRQTSGYKPPTQQQQQSNQDGPNLEYTENMMDTGIEMSAAHQSQFKAKEVDCSTTAGEVATSLAGMFGGRVKCNDNSGFQKYIDARLKKNP